MDEFVPARVSPALVLVTRHPAVAIAMPVPTPTSRSAAGSFGMAYDTLLKPKDRLDVHVVEATELFGSYVVLSDGNIELPLVGTLQASGLSEQAVAARIADAYSRNGFIYKPHVTVSSLGEAGSTK